MQQQQQQQQQNTNPNNDNNSSGSHRNAAAFPPKRPTMQMQDQQQQQQPSNDLSKKSFSGYKNMAQCLDVETQKNGLSHLAAVEYCSKSFKDHLKAHPSDNTTSQPTEQQPSQPQPTKTANNMNWQQLRSTILRRS
jgi:hypothetical protein